jgi:aspartyl protease
MPRFSGTFDPVIGPLLDVIVLPFVGLYTPGMPLPTASNTALFAEHTEEKPATQISAIRVPALIDTAANVTCITPQLAQTLNLEPRGKRPFAGASQAELTVRNIYLVDLVLLFQQEDFPLLGWQVQDMALNVREYQLLLGRDILYHGTFTMSKGYFTFEI